MENRDRDKMSKSTGSTPAGDVNRSTSSNIGQQKSGSNVNFGEKVGRSENIESDTGDLSRSSANRGSAGSSGSGSGMHDSGRSSGSSGLGSSSGRSGSSGIGKQDKKSTDRGGSSNESL